MVKEGLACPVVGCDFVAKGKAGLAAHLAKSTKHGGSGFMPGSGKPLHQDPPAAALQPDLFAGGEALLQEKDGRIAELEAELESRGIAEYPGEVQAAYLLESLTRLEPETVAVLVGKAGKASMLREATAAEVAEAEQEPSEQEDPAVVKGPTDRPGYKFLAELGVSIKR